jgi:hypothetical protein
MPRTKQTARKPVGKGGPRKQLVDPKKLAGQYSCRLKMLHQNLSKLVQGDESVQHDDPQELFGNRPEGSSPEIQKQWDSKEKAITVLSEQLDKRASDEHNRLCCVAAVLNGLSAQQDPDLHKKFGYEEQSAFREAAGRADFPLDPEDKYRMAGEPNGWMFGCGGQAPRVEGPVDVDLVREDRTCLVRVAGRSFQACFDVGSTQGGKAAHDCVTLRTGRYDAVRREDGDYDLLKKTVKAAPPKKRGSFRFGLDSWLKELCEAFESTEQWELYCKDMGFEPSARAHLVTLSTEGLRPVSQSLKDVRRLPVDITIRSPHQTTYKGSAGKTTLAVPAGTTVEHLLETSIPMLFGKGSQWDKEAKACKPNAEGFIKVHPDEDLLYEASDLLLNGTELTVKAGR